MWEVKVWAVFVHCEIPGNVSRWIDSLWADETHAMTRETQLDKMLIPVFRVPGHRTTRVQMEVMDAVITDAAAGEE